jgi:hypothetical protein
MLVCVIVGSLGEIETERRKGRHLPYFNENTPT